MARISSQQGLPAVPCSWVRLETVLHGCAGSLSRLPGQVGLQAMLCNWVRSLAKLLAWARKQLCSAIRQGSRLDSAIAWSCRLSSMTSCTISWVQRLLRLPSNEGPEAMLISWTGLLAWLSAQGDWKMCSTAARHLWPRS